MKTLLVATAVSAAALACCGAATAATAPTLKGGELTVAFGDPAVGFSKGTVRGNTITNPRGYEVDLATAIAKQLGISKINWAYTPWTGLFNAGPKKFDISFQQATITAQRKRTVTFSTPYLEANQGVLLSKRADTPKSQDDLKKLQTCAQTDTTGLDWIKTRLRPEKDPLTYQTTAATFTAVQVGKCDAIILDVPIVALQKKSRPSAYGEVAGQIVTDEEYGAVMAKASKLAPAVDKAIGTLTKNGTIDKLQKKWFNISFSSIPKLT